MIFDTSSFFNKPTSQERSANYYMMTNPQPPQQAYQQPVYPWDFPPVDPSILTSPLGQPQQKQQSPQRSGRGLDITYGSTQQTDPFLNPLPSQPGSQIGQTPFANMQPPQQPSFDIGALNPLIALLAGLLPPMSAQPAMPQQQPSPAPQPQQQPVNTR